MNDSNAGTENKGPVMSKEDIAYFIRTQWDSLLKPAWPRALLIDWGTAIHDKMPLSKIDPDRLGKLLPFLSTVAEHLGQQVTIKFTSEFEAFLKTTFSDHPEVFADFLATNSETKVPVLTREEIAYYIRTMHDSLLKPSWERGDLIDLGMAVFTKITLAKMDQKKLGRLLPNLSVAAEHFGQLVATKFSAKFDSMLKTLSAQLEAKTASAQAAPEPPALEQPAPSSDVATEPSELNPVVETAQAEAAPSDAVAADAVAAEPTATENNNG